MILRSIAYLIIVLGCGYMGMMFTARMDARIKQLSELLSMLRQLSFNIGFLSLPVAEAVSRAAENQGGAVRKILDEVSAVMRANPDISPSKAWSGALERHSGELCLKKAEIKALEEFSENVGKGDVRETLDGIQMIAAKLKLASDEAAAERAKDGKLYRGMGFMTGILIVILLF